MRQDRLPPVLSIIKKCTFRATWRWPIVTVFIQPVIIGERVHSPSCLTQSIIVYLLTNRPNKREPLCDSSTLTYQPLIYSKLYHCIGSLRPIKRGRSKVSRSSTTSSSSSPQKAWRHWLLTNSTHGPVKSMVKHSCTFRQHRTHSDYLAIGWVSNACYLAENPIARELKKQRR